MGFGEAYLNIQILLQAIHSDVQVYDLNEGKLKVNPKLKSGIWRLPVWLFNQLGILFAFIICIWRCTVIHKEKSKDYFLIEMAAFYICLIGACLQTLVSSYHMIKCPEWTIFVTNEVFRMGNLKHVGWPSTKRLPDLQELMGYGMALTILVAPCMSLAIPFIRPYDPFSVIFSSIFPGILSTIIIGCVNFVLGFVSAIQCLTLLLIILTCCQIFEHQTESNLKRSIGQSTDKQLSSLEKNIINPLVKFVLLQLETFTSYNPVKKNTIEICETSPIDVQVHCLQREARSEFEKLLHNHKQMYILMEVSNKSVSVYIPSMAGAGILICVAVNVFCTTFYDRKEIRMIVMVFFIGGVFVYGLILFFCFHASRPAVFSQNTIHFWKGNTKRSRVEKRQVRSMRTVGFTIGPFFVAKRSTAMDILDTILDYTITLKSF